MNHLLNLVSVLGFTVCGESGSYNIAQDKKSSMIFGMPKEAIKLKAAQSIVSLTDIADEIVKAVMS